MPSDRVDVEAGFVAYDASNPFSFSLMLWKYETNNNGA